MPRPEIFEHVDEVDHDGDGDAAIGRLGLDAVDLVVVSVDERHPGTGMGGVASFGFLEDVPQYLCGIVDNARGDPLVLGDGRLTKRKTG